jgi:ABC-2 type transport system permease protein
MMVEGQRQSLWHYVIKLLRLRWLLFRSGFKRSKTISKIFTVIFGLFLLGLFIGVFAGSYLLLRFLYSPEMAQYIGDIRTFVRLIPILVIAGAFLVNLLTSFGVLLQALYLTGDMDFLLAAPIPIRAVFISKLLQAILPNFTLVGLVGLPLLFGIGAAGSYFFLYYPLVIVVLAFLSLAAAGISSLLVMVIARIFPARRVAEVLAFFGAIFSIVCSQLGNLTSGQDFGEVTPQDLSQGLQTLEMFNSGWSPLAYGGRGLVDLGEGRWFSGIFYLALTLALSGGVFYLALAGAERLYYSGWASMQVGTQRKKIKTGSRAAPQGRLLQRFLPAPIRANIIKDLKMIRRDLRNMSQVVTPLIFGIIYAIMMLRNGPEPPPGQGEAPEFFMEILRVAILYGSVAISLFVGWTLQSRLALMAFSMEGKSYWMIRTSPVRAEHLLLSKFLVAYLPSLVLGWLFLVGIGLVQRPPLSALLYEFPVVALILAGLAGINLAFGVKGANLTWTDPRRVSTGGTGCLSSIASMAYLVGSLALFFVPAIGLQYFQVSPVLSQVIGLLLGGVVTILCTVLPPLLVRNQVYKIGEGI